MEINYLAILLSTIASIVIGSVWFGPLFGKKFMEAIGMDKWTQEQKNKETKKMGLTYFLQFVASFVMFFVLAWYIAISNHPGVLGGLNNAFWAWLGFVVPIKLGDSIWGGKMSLFWLNIGNMLLTLLAGGAIIGAFQ